jgi:hypothetical protein
VQLIDPASGKLVGEGITWCRLLEARPPPAKRARKAFDGAAAIGMDVSMSFRGYGVYHGMVCSRERVREDWKYTLCFHANSDGSFAARGDKEQGDVVVTSEGRLAAALSDGSCSCSRA